MKYLFLALSSFLAITAQMIAGNNFFIFNFLDLSLILIAYWAIYRSRTQALFVGSLTGLLLDAAMGWPLGYNGFGKTLAAFIIGQSWKRFNTRESWVQFAIIAVSSLASSVSMFGLFWIMQRTTSRIFLGASLVQALVTAFITIVIFTLMETYRHNQADKAH
ncbi:MAG: rod shape-determining protein MreD [Acidobacteria bacterium]|nr:rod shape-determining protein MreD [Acidobacteriota bacterium]